MIPKVILKRADLQREGDEMLRRLLWWAVLTTSWVSVRQGLRLKAPRPQDSLSGRQENAKKRAAVAVARKLSVLLRRLWITGELYEPLHNKQRSAGRTA